MGVLSWSPRAYSETQRGFTMSEEKETHNYVLAYVAGWIAFAVIVVCIYKYELRKLEIEEQIRKENVSPVKGVSK